MASCFGLEAEQRCDRAEGLLARHASSPASTSVSDRGLEEGAAERMALAALDDAARPWPPRRRRAPRPWRAPWQSISGPWSVDALEPVADAQSGRRPPPAWRRRLRRHRLCTSRRLAQTQVCPVLRYLLAMRAGDRGVEVGVVEHDEGRVAAEFQRELLQGARRTAPSASCRCSVEPVKVSLRTLGLTVSSPPIAAAPRR